MRATRLAGTSSTESGSMKNRRRLWRWVIVVAGVLALIPALFMILSATTGGHTLLAVSYSQHPPNQGDHSPVWQRCGFYSEPVDDEHAVHSLEHGAIWITFRPDLPLEQQQILREFARIHDDILISPYPELPTLALVSAWGRQAPLDVIDASHLERTTAEIRNGLEAPEPGGGCDGPNLWFTGATGDPEP